MFQQRTYVFFRHMFNHFESGGNIGETLGKHLYQYPPKSPDFSNFIINNLFFHFFFIFLNILYFNNLAFAYPELAPACPSNISIKFLIFINFYVSISYIIFIFFIRGMWGNIWG